MIRQITIGKPFDTEAVTGSYEEWTGALPYLTAKEEGTFSYEMDPDDVVYGLGETLRGINKRGWLYVSQAADDPNHTETKNSLYGVHNFILVDGKERFGLFVDYPGKMTFDIGYTDIDVMTITIPDSNAALYIIDGEGYSLDDIVREFRSLVGRSYIPPKWAFGYGQSRWSYMSSDEVREVVKEYREADIPLDTVVLDIDYMERYKDFTINEETFPDFDGLVDEMKAQGIHLVPIIDGGVKIEDGYETYEEGVDYQYFCKDEEGKDFVVGVWPGRVHFPDMLNADARRWFGLKYKFLIDKGIEGFWNDMNEPAIFYSEKNLNAVLDRLGEFKGRNLDLKTYGEFQMLVGTLNNNEKDYASFYHEHKDGRVRHDKVHNLFGFNMTRAAGEAFDELVPDKRILMYSRSSYIGMHRYGGIWTGDNQSWWSHILLNIKQMPSLNMCGFLFTGADLGGFGGNTTEDLLLRWLAVGVFTPLMRNHSAMGTRRQEAYRFTKTDAFRSVISLRYVLLPYIYSEFMKAALGDGMYIRPLSFVYPEDTFVRTVEDQLMVGESIMIAPVYEQNAKGRYVYLPEDMKLIRCRGLVPGRGTEGMTEELLEKGHHYIDVALDEVIFFIRPEHIVPVSMGGSCVEQVDGKNLKLLAYVLKGATYELYDDDGYSKDYDAPENRTKITVDADGGIWVEGNKTCTLA